MMNLFDEFRLVITEMNRAGIAYAVCGGMAMAAYGHARATQDIDRRSDRHETYQRQASGFGRHRAAARRDRMSVDMSSQAITTRLRCVSDLRRVCRALSARVPPTEVREGEIGYAARSHSRTEPAHAVKPTVSPVQTETERGIDRVPAKTG
jgi:hypothetical protein